MALSSQSLFLYGYTIGLTNSNLDFKASALGPTLTAAIPLGDYSLSSLLSAIALAMTNADPANTYQAVADRTIMGGTQNRITISTSGSFLSLLFGTGPSVNTSVASLIGFSPIDSTGHMAYTGNQSTGVTLMPSFIGYNYRDDLNQAKVFGAVNVSAAGLKEAVVFNIQKFIDVQFKYEDKSRLQEWQNLFYWLIQQKPFDFTPEITNPTRFFPVTLEKSDYEGKGLGYQLKEMLPNFPNLYDTGPLNLRIVLDYTTQMFTSGG